jgi:hypothetical protein
MKNTNLYEAPRWVYCVWKHGKTNGRYRQSFRPLNCLELAIGNSAASQGNIRYWGILPQTPWDLTLSRQDSRARESRWGNPILLSRNPGL